MAEGSVIDDDFQAFAAGKIRELDAAEAAHRAACGADPCDTCKRFRCPACAVRVATKSHCGPCEVVRQRDRVLASIDLARDFYDCDLSGPRARKVLSPATLARAASLLQAKRVVFTGPPGAGKTTLLAGMAIARVTTAHPRWRGFWVSAHNLAKARAQASLGSEPEMVRRALQAELLCIDEVGGEEERYGSALSEVIYERHAQGRATWCTTGVSAQAIATRYGGGIARRLFEDVERFDLVRGQ